MQIGNLLTDSAVLQELGERLARTRLERNLTQAQLAHEAGLAPLTVLRLERGEGVKLTSLVRVLRVLGMLEALDRLIPEPTPSPIELVKLQGRRRRRASGARVGARVAVKGDAYVPAGTAGYGGPRPGVAADTRPTGRGAWRWGDERRADP
jgi:transcriptional regulator with XRE-family HTH domain